MICASVLHSTNQLLKILCCASLRSFTTQKQERQIKRKRTQPRTEYYKSTSFAQFDIVARSLTWCSGIRLQAVVRAVVIARYALTPSARISSEATAPPNQH